MLPLMSFSFRGSDDALVDEVWNKGTTIEGYPPNMWRRDAYGNAIRYTDYGNRDSDYGWEMDHIVPASLGGSDDPSNLRPLHWRSNASRGNGR